MKWGFFLFLIFTLFSCTELKRTPQSEISFNHPINVIFDIDWTIVSSFEEGVSTAPASKIITVENQKYIPRAGLSDLVEYLITNNIQVSFFSGGSNSRNMELLSKIKLSDGRSLLDIAFKVKSNDDLTVISSAEANAKFSDKFKKDVSKISSDLENTILIDDTANFYFGESQRENLIHLGPTFKYFESFEDAKKVSGDYIPKNLDEWQFDHYKFSVIKEQLEESLRLMQDRGIGLKKAMNIVGKKVDLDSGTFNIHTLRVLKSIEEVNRHNLMPSSSCTHDILNFLPVK